MQPLRRSALPSRAERQQQHTQHDPTLVTGNGSNLTKLLQRARQAGHLKLQGRQLLSLPDEIWDIATVELPDNTNWWETRETLETIDVSQNEIACLPDYFAAKLDQLREFNIAHNKLTALPSAQSWCALSGLVNLSLAHNELSGLPEHFGHGNLPPLVRLSAEHNHLQTLPPSLGMLSDLVELDLSHNQLTSLPPGLCGLCGLKKLQLCKNRLFALPPDFLEAPPQLQELDLSENRLQSLALAVPTLQTVLLGNNSLGALELSGCDSLQELSAPYNVFSTLPAGLPMLPRLATLDLSNNRIVLIDDLADCLGLTRLEISCNEISFVPPRMGNLPLNRLAISANPLRTLPNHIREAPTPKLLAHLRGKIVDPSPQWEGDTRGTNQGQARPGSRDGRRPDQGSSLITGVTHSMSLEDATRPPEFFDRGLPPPPEYAERAPLPPPSEPFDPYATTAQLLSRQQQIQRQQRTQQLVVQQTQQQTQMQMKRQQQPLPPPPPQLPQPPLQPPPPPQPQPQPQPQQSTPRLGTGYRSLYDRQRPPSGRCGGGGGGGTEGARGAAAAAGAGGGDSAHDYKAEARAAADYNLQALQAAKARREACGLADERSHAHAEDRDAGSAAHLSTVDPGGARARAASAPQQHAEQLHAGPSHELTRFIMREGTDLCIGAMGLTELPTGGYPDTLTRIDASGNQLGAVPEALGRLVPSLRVLDVTSNRLRELPADLCDCHELQTLRASHNSLRSLSFLPQPLQRLAELHADKNGLSSVPPSLWICPRLKHVSLCANRLDLASLAMPIVADAGGSTGGAGRPGGAVAPLEHLDLGENRLGALPPLGLYPQLREVHVQQNGIRELPVPQLAPLMQLQTLDISMNDVSQLPPDLARLPLLQNLTIVGNPIRSIPQSVQQRGATAVIDLLRKRLPA